MLGPTFSLYWRSIFESARSANVKNLWEIKWKLCTNIALLALKIQGQREKIRTCQIIFMKSMSVKKMEDPWNISDCSLLLVNLTVLYLQKFSNETGMHIVYNCLFKIMIVFISLNHWINCFHLFCIVCRWLGTHVNEYMRH